MQLKKNNGFTLIELSVVLVIIGLLVGGVLGGQSLLNAARVKKVLTDAVTYRVAAEQFRLKYDYLPGDFPTATQVWGDDAAACADAAVADGIPGTCNGDGNGMVIYAAAANATAEIFQYWKQMTLAGLISGNFTGLNGPGNANYHVIPGTNGPIGALPNTTYWIFPWNYQPASSTFFEGDYGSTMTFGTATAAAWPYAGALRPKEQFGLDSKIDDGYPGFGTIRTLTKTWMDATVGVGCVSSDTASSASYVLTNTSQVCIILFMPTFRQAPEQ